MHFLMQPEDESGEAADTGSAMHHAVHTWHNTSQDAAASIEAMHEAHGRYKRADLADAAALFLQYAQDPENQAATVVTSERKIKFQLDPAPEDKTGAPIVIVGTLDQVRRMRSGELRLYDLKTSKKQGFVIMVQHLYQVAAYCVGATMELGEQVHPGAIIRARSYPQNPFFRYSIDLVHAVRLMNSLRHSVAAIRNGEPTPSPALEWCEWCHARTPDNCVPMLEKHAPSNFVNLGRIER